MYRINYLNRPTLITPDEVLFHAATDNNIDARQIMQNIIVAEERIIAPAITDEFYEELLLLKNQTVTTTNQAALVAQINNSSITAANLPVGTIVNAIEFITNADYVALWNRFLWKLTAEAVDMMTTVPSWLRHTSVGQQKNRPAVIGGNGEGSATGDRKDIQFKIDMQMQERIDPLIERMRQYICKNRPKFPTYKRECGEYGFDERGHHDEADGISILRKTDWVFNAYEERDRRHRDIEHERYFR
jgi:hypothetical protein